MKIIKEFKEFAVKGNMVDMAIGIVIGASFKSVVDVLVKQIIMPPLTFVSNGINLKDKKVVLQEASEGISEIAIGYGALIETFLDFIIIGFTLFVVVKFMNKLKQKSQDVEDETVETPKDIEILNNILNELKEQNGKK